MSVFPFLTPNFNSLHLNKPWTGLTLHVDKHVRSLFQASVKIFPSDGATSRFWHDPWLINMPLKSEMLDMFSSWTTRRCSIKHELCQDKWIMHFNRDMNQASLDQFIIILDCV
jgi:hypothetical protein